MWEVIKQIIELNFANIADLSQDHNTFAQKNLWYKMVHISSYYHRRKVSLLLTSPSVIVEFINIHSMFEKMKLINIIKEYKSMMCNI